MKNLRLCQVFVREPENMNGVKLNSMLETAIEAARLAGIETLKAQSNIQISIKNQSEVVTDADKRCQQIIIDKISACFPEDGFIAEEGTEGKIFKQQPKNTEKIWWVIDPIDGTNNFVNQMPFFSISIAAMKDGFPIVGVVFEPANNSMFTAVKDGQAGLNDTPIIAKAEPLGQFSSVALDSYFDKHVAAWANKIMQITKFRNLGSTAMHLAYVAKGSLAAAIFSHSKLWDIAAGALIAQTAGAIISDWKGNPVFPVDLDNYNGERFRVAAANKKSHSEIIRLINT